MVSSGWWLVAAVVGGGGGGGGDYLARAVALQDPRHHHHLGAVELAEARRVGGLVSVVNLLQNATHQLVRHRPQVRAPAHDLLNDRGEPAQHVGVQHDPRLEAGPLYLDRDVLTRALDRRPIDLPEAGGGDGL